MNGCPECDYLGYPCPRHDRADGCTCPTDDSIVVGCDPHGHLIDAEPVAA